jgi:hypothetical protein
MFRAIFVYDYARDITLYMLTLALISPKVAKASTVQRPWYSHVSMLTTVTLTNVANVNDPLIWIVCVNLNLDRPNKLMVHIKFSILTYPSEKMSKLTTKTDV